MKNDKFTDSIFLAPALLGTLIFIVIPVILSFALSFYNWDLITKPEFVAFKNYIEIIKAPLFYKVLLNTVIYSLSVTVLGVVIPLVLAAAINSKIKGADFFKSAMFIPFITPMVIIAIVWQWIFDPNIGFLNYLLRIHVNWLYDPFWAMPAVIIVSVWKLLGYNMIILLTGFATISSDVYESAKLDGANSIQTFFRITLPLLSPIIFFVMIITTISSFQVFDLIYLMTQGGPMNSTNVLVYWLYKYAFEYFECGKASALAYILFIIIAVLTLLQWKLRKSWVNNE